MSTNRRDFLKAVIPAGAFACLGCSAAFAAGGEAAPKHKFDGPSGMSYEEMFRFGYGRYTIPPLQAMAKAMGKEKFLQLMKKASYDSSLEIISPKVAKWPQRDFPTFKSKIINSLASPFMQNVTTSEITKNTDTELSLKITECLWAKIFKEAQAADLGFAMVCHTDYAYPQAVAPNIKLLRTKTLMQSHSCCDHKYVIEG